MSEVISDMQIEQLEKIIELKNEQIHILARKLEAREQQLKEAEEALADYQSERWKLLDKLTKKEQQLKEAESVIESLQTRNDQQAKILEFFETNSPIFYKQMLDYFLQTDNYVTIE